MLEYSRWKYVVALIVLLASALYALPNLYPQDAAVQITANRGFAVDDALDTRVEGLLEGAGIATKSVQKEGDSLLVRLDAADQLRAAELLRPALEQGYTVAQNLVSTVPDWLDAFGASPMRLGLDLQGGVHFLLQVDQKAALEKRENSYAEQIRVVLREQKIPSQEVTVRPNDILVRLSRAEDLSKALSVVAVDAPELQLQPLRGSAGPGFTASIAPAALQALLTDTINQNVSILRNRINALGVAEPIVTRQGDSRIVVQLPGVQDTALAKRVIGATATLEYRAALLTATDAIEAERTGRVPPEGRIYYMRERNPDGSRIPVVLAKRVIAAGDQLVAATSITDTETGTPGVSVTLNASAGQRMFDFTSQNVGKPMAVVYIERVPEVRIVDGQEVRGTKVTEEIISLASIRGVFSRNFQTTGLESPQEAQQLALLLRSGALAAPMEFAEERIIGPSLGAENIARGLESIAASFVLVLVFFVIYYRMFGVITNIALLLNLLMLVAVMSIVGATLSLPGLAGIALTVGLSVDANVLINERIREELRAGNTPLNAIATGYEKAAGTIADANVTALLAGIALFVFGTGPVKGFALSLIIGILTSMYTAVSVSRGVATLIYGRRRKLAGLAI
ncbi:protein translocase subunit SecD [Silanimonas sp.]|jgi:preprotein translocase subunit SecD|uniref:protein translocase subunit SecD n=1 Tax=Silanimonas sp. TaxID=1929290 RepID=UPI0037CC76D4